MSEEIVANNVVTPCKPIKKKRPKSKGRIIFEWILFGLFGLFFAFVLAGNIDGMAHKKQNYGQSIRFGVGSFIVLTNSMEPEIKKDSAILTYKEDFKKIKSEFEKGKKIDLTFANVDVGLSQFVPDTEEFKYENGGRIVVTNRIMTHRLVEFHEDTTKKIGEGRYILITTGINNEGDYSKMGQYQIFTEGQYLGKVVFNNSFLGKVFNFIVSPWGLIVVLLVPAGYLIVVSSIDIFKTLRTAEEEQKEVYKDGALASLSASEREKLKKELLDQMINEKMKQKEKDNEKKD